MRVSLEKHGGFGAGLRHPARIVDSSALAEPQQVELSQLVSAVKAATPSLSKESGHMRDAMTFVISVDDDGNSMVFRQTDLGMSEPFGQLLTWLERYSAGLSP